MKPEYKNIIVAVDGSKEADIAFTKSLDISKQNNSRLIIAHVVDTRSIAIVEPYDRTIIEKVEQDTKDMIDNYVNRAKNAGVENLIPCIKFGSPRTVLTKDLAKEYDVDLIICGATGLNAVERFFIGSVSESIVRYAPCDVLVVRS
ncbi:universal stress protein [Virgibacillus soli]|uniref:Universal stress protein n=1 Tax=Paracerasibacillus soli TaxID=480284 RepID=A0ABU5CQK6_9BACI|nr:universal stress protein [Virgibacillus soli]MDY0408667.1 universal stress protein [Virgibacillus soli]